MTGFANLKVGDAVTRMLGGTIPMKLSVSAITDAKLHSRDVHQNLSSDSKTEGRNSHQNSHQRILASRRGEAKT
jgi:hypothetical protein